MQRIRKFPALAGSYCRAPGQVLVMGPAVTCKGLGRKLRGRYYWKARSRLRAAGALGEQSDSAGAWQMEHSIRACSAAGKTRGRLCFPPSRARRGSGSLQAGL